MNFKEYLAKTEKNAEEELAVLHDLTTIFQKKNELTPIEYRAAKAALQVLIENAIGKAKHLLRHYQCPVTPVSAHDAFKIMREVDMIDDTSYSRFIKAVGFRNAMIHDYLNFKPEVLLILLKSKEYAIIGDFLTQDRVPSELVLKRLKSFAPIA